MKYHLCISLLVVTLVAACGPGDNNGNNENNGNNGNNENVATNSDTNSDTNNATNSDDNSDTNSDTNSGTNSDTNAGTNTGTNNNAAAIQASIDAHEKYEDISVALEDGYTSTVEFVTHPDTGAGMGIHFVNMGITEVDPSQAHVLMYDVAEDGTFELMGVEWLVPTAAVDEAPVLFGQTFEGPFEGHGPDQPEHYELHAWFYKDNPDGMFAGFNPDVSPPSWWADLATTLEAIAPYADVATAETDGYVSTGECVANPDGDGAMGVHYVNEDITGVSTDSPNVLMYGDDGAGNMVLLGVEWFVPTAAVDEAPTLFGQTFGGPFEGHEPGQPEHYELHVWTHAANPAGYFAPFNTHLSCP